MAGSRRSFLTSLLRSFISSIASQKTLNHLHGENKWTASVQDNIKVIAFQDFVKSARNSNIFHYRKPQLAFSNGIGKLLAKVRCFTLGTNSGNGGMAASQQKIDNVNGDESVSSSEENCTGHPMQNIRRGVSPVVSRSKP
jgi:hypothetical protein